MNNGSKIPAFVTYKYLHECFYIREDDGALIWKEIPLNHFNSKSAQRSMNTQFAGKVAGSISSEGYLRCCFKRKHIGNHWIIWMMVTGSWPKEQIDHKNRIRNDNRFENLRESSAKLNPQNLGIMETNSSGYTGIHKRGSGWCARLSINGKNVWLGTFKTIEKALLAYSEAKKSHLKNLLKSELQASQSPQDQVKP